MKTQQNKPFLLPTAFDDAKFKGLSDGAKLIYSRIYSLSHAEHSKKLGGSVVASDKYFAEKCHWSTSKVYRVLNELKEWNLISTNVLKHSLTRTTRYINLLPFNEAKQPSPVNSAKAEDHSPVKEAPFISVESTIHQCREDHSPVISIIDKELKKTIKKGNTPEEPFLVDVENKIKNMNKEELMQWETRYLYGKFDMSGQPGWRNLILNMSPEDIALFEEYSNSVVPSNVKDKLTPIIEGRLFVTQKQT
jgi:hypothetical protein